MIKRNVSGRRSILTELTVARFICIFAARGLAAVAERAGVIKTVRLRVLSRYPIQQHVCVFVCVC